MPARRFTVSRRTMMKTFAGIAGAASFRGLLREAFADPTPAYPRFVVLNNPHGVAPDFWRPQAPGGGPADTTGWTLDYDPDSSLGPLEKHKDSMVIIEGLDLTCNYKDGAAYLGHNGGCVAPLTGLHAQTTENSGSLTTTGPSIDYFLAKQTGVEPFLFFPLGYNGYDLATTFDSTGQRVPNETDLKASFTKWFGSFMGPSQMADPKAAARQKADLAVLGYLNNDAKKLQTRLAGPEKAKLQAHMDALNLLVSKIAGTSTTPPLMSCVKPTQPMSGMTGEALIQGGLLFAAELFACSLTRSATVLLDPAGSGSMPWLLGDIKIHDMVAHAYRPDDPATGRQLSKVQRWYASQVAYFVDLLKGIPEGNGTVYDNTIILWTNELGDPARHMNNNLPFVVLGGGGTFPRGRYLKFSTGSEYADTQAPHGPLLTSLVNQYGMNLTAFGDPLYPGELPGFMG